MKIALITKNRKPFICVVRNSRVIVLQAAYDEFRRQLKLPLIDSEHFSNPLLFIQNFGRIKKTVSSLLSKAENASNKKTNYTLSLSRAKLMAPVPKPRSIYCLARNYSEHILEFNERVVEQDKMVPPIFIKPQTCVTGPGGPVILPQNGRQIDWEAELAVVIGKKAKYVSVEGALKHVFGYTCMLDISERGLKIWDRTEDRGRDKFFDWLNGKWMDTFAPQGPWIVTKDEIEDPQSLNIKLSVNGLEKQNAGTEQMIFPVAQIISYLSQIVTLMPGDIISTGTPSGVGAPQGTFLKHGDFIEMNIEKIGCLSVLTKSS
ncbi:MAG: fumarylacetoacetate hydrolase family protein [Nitrospinota bacterium]|nr:fumarylacetoacetate hydrolase family protein [Nitrospinota bacterium]